MKKFEQYLINNNIFWVRTKEGYLELKDETFKEMVVSGQQMIDSSVKNVSENSLHLEKYN
jgi:hypothetical protein